MTYVACYIPAMPTLLTLLGTALLFGMRHATDPDHVVAVTTIVSRERSVWRAARIGALWGLGHTVTVVTVGAAVILLRVAITPRVGLSLEFAVAVMLVVLGALNLAAARPGSGLAQWTVPPAVVGLVHGLAGSAAATLLVLALVPDPRAAMAALLVFCVGTMLGMALVTAAIAAPASLAADRVVRLQRGFRIAAGLLSVAFGLYLAHRIGVGDGLFTATPRWSPA